MKFPLRIEGAALALQRIAFDKGKTVSDFSFQIGDYEFDEEKIQAIIEDVIPFLIPIFMAVSFVICVTLYFRERRRTKELRQYRYRRLDVPESGNDWRPDPPLKTPEPEEDSASVSSGPYYKNSWEIWRHILRVGQGNLGRLNSIEQHLLQVMDEKAEEQKEMIDEAVKQLRSESEEQISLKYTQLVQNVSESLQHMDTMLGALNARITSVDRNRTGEKEDVGVAPNPEQPIFPDMEQYKEILRSFERRQSKERELYFQEYKATIRELLKETGKGVQEQKDRRDPDYDNSKDLRMYLYFLDKQRVALEDYFNIGFRELENQMLHTERKEKGLSYLDIHMAGLGGTEGILFIEMIPKGGWNQNVRSVLGEEEWNQIRRKVYEKERMTCHTCRSFQIYLEAHEVWEFDETSQTQKLVDIIGICNNCHKTIHFGRTKKMGGERAARLWFMYVNKCNERAFDDIVTKAWERQEHLNQIPSWKLDISYIEQFGVACPEEYK